MNKTTLNFESNLDNEELGSLLNEFETTLIRKSPEVESIEFIQHSNSAFDAIVTFNNELGLDKQIINVSLAEVGLSGFII